MLEHLPHRYPFLMVDRIVDVDGDNSAVGLKNVTFNEPQFAGHFPHMPIMPGVLLIEGMAQTAAVICVASIETKRRPMVYFMTIDRAKFRRPVVPGDTVEISRQENPQTTEYLEVCVSCQGWRRQGRGGGHQCHAG